LRQVDSGSLRILWSTYQIVQSVCWIVPMPPPFKGLLQALTVFSFDFVPLDCSVHDALKGILIWSIVPIVLVLLTLTLFCIRRFAMVRRNEPRNSLDRLRNEFSFVLLMFSFVILPTTTQKQFQALDCQFINGRSYLRVNTSISCESEKYARFRIILLIFIFIYLSVLPLWGVVLFRIREKINPNVADMRLAYYLRDTDSSLKPFSFLYDAYSPAYFAMEIPEM
jgi:hypothetical protein